MANFSPYKINIGTTDYPLKDSLFKDAVEIFATEVESARDGLDTLGLKLKDMVTLRQYDIQTYITGPFTQNSLAISVIFSRTVLFEAQPFGSCAVAYSSALDDYLLDLYKRPPPYTDKQLIGSILFDKNNIVGNLVFPSQVTFNGGDLLEIWAPDITPDIRLDKIAINLAGLTNI